MTRPPDSIAALARHHWLRGGATSVFVAPVFTGDSHAFERSPKGYAITLGIAATYLTAGTLVSFGTPVGRYLSYACSFIYLARPQLGLRPWRLISTPEFKSHFTQPNVPTP